ncbi:MAG TPA: BTAD domain-containing putative transcriptional regulator [Ktedonobacterales bacterium]|nr:BTAD domain-containing putative transcriptional regulator [Ktedonobacterales bacterium]
MGRDQLDVGRFEDLLRRGKELLNESPAEAAVVLGEALSLWRGPALADVADAGFAQAEAARLADLRVVAQESRIEAQLALGHQSDLVGELEALVRQHPMRERLCGLLMLCLYRSGRQAEASQAYQGIRERLVEELGMEPGPELQQLLEQILNQHAAIGPPRRRVVSPSAERTNLSLELSSFVGRSAELEEIKRFLHEARLVTLTGAGGIGKTRLALHLGSQLVDEYADGVWLVELAAVTDPGILPQIMLATLDFTQQPGRTPLESLISALASQERMCIIDNCEHLVDAVARLCDSLLRRCPRLRVLATSREPLGLEGETTWRVPSLATTSDSASTPWFDRPSPEAVQLFVERAVAARPGFGLTDDNSGSVARICNRLHGIPLAIELAAARVRRMSVTAIEEHLDDCFELLASGSRVSLPRQQTLQATLDWSHDLLTPDEKKLFRRLSVFLGGFTLSGVGAVCADAEVDTARASVLDCLGGLVDKSLVLWEEGSDPSPHYRLLEPVRQYGRDRLMEAGETEDTQRKHAHFYLALGEEAQVGLRGPHQLVWFRRVEDELDNFRVCFEWILREDGALALRLVLALWRYWTDAHYGGEGREWLIRALAAHPHRDDLRAHGLYGASFWTSYRGEYAEARRLGQECLLLAQQLGSSLLTGHALIALGCVESLERRKGWIEQSRTLCEQAEPLLRQSASPDELARELNNIGVILREAGDLITAKAKLEEAVSLAHSLGDTMLMHVTLNTLAGIQFEGGEVEAADAHCRRALRIAGDLRSHGWVMTSLTLLALMAAATEQPQRCLRLLGAASVLQKRIGLVSSSEWSRRRAEAERSARQHLGQEAADAAWREGIQMSLMDAVRYGDEDVLPAAQPPR